MSTSVAATDKFLRKEIQNEERRKQVKLLALSFLFRLQQIKQKPFFAEKYILALGLNVTLIAFIVVSLYIKLYKMTNETFKRCHSSKVIESISTFLFEVMYGIKLIQTNRKKIQRVHNGYSCILRICCKRIREA